MGNFGEDLRMERLSRGVALEDITAVTKISQHHLVALEQERFRLLPGGILSKGIVRGYTGALGLDQRDWTERPRGLQRLRPWYRRRPQLDSVRGQCRQGPHVAPRRHGTSPALGRRHPAASSGFSGRIFYRALYGRPGGLVVHSAARAPGSRLPWISRFRPARYLADTGLFQSVAPEKNRSGKSGSGRPKRP